MSRAGLRGEDAMKKFIVALFIALLAAMPLAAEAQVKKKKKQNQNQDPIMLLLGIFGTANCIVGCGSVPKLVVTTVFIPERERFVTTVTKTSSAGSYLGGAIACTAIWPFLNAALGYEPTSEQAVLYTASCWIPGLGLILFLREQQGAT
jgi:hypothetical protein